MALSPYLMFTGLVVLAVLALLLVLVTRRSTATPPATPPVCSRCGRPIEPGQQVSGELAWPTTQVVHAHELAGLGSFRHREC